ncbi:hypothetical protein TrST_g8821 [Triparma strigata]|uniref:Chlorophyll a-b binding protein, chloroplastic n=1 Tax=Triparma strigata TaxID=1606541 RepID=A0A9W7C2E5_9STRA|nr:hypothetical protein TrST_g8821 [Triparma strigata]
MKLSLNKVLVLLVCTLNATVHAFHVPISSLSTKWHTVLAAEPPEVEDVIYSTKTDPTVASSYADTTNTVVGGESPAIPTSEFSNTAPINGWVPSSTSPCFGLPGVVAPTGYFDPIGFSRSGITLSEVKRYREAEVQHGRVAMLATVGYIIGEGFSGPFGMSGPANDQLQNVPLPAFVLLTLGIAAAELNRARIGWVEPDLGSWTKTLFKLRENYYPGDIGFDPLGLKPTDAKGFEDMQTKELQNGRLAMLGWAGMCSQELVNHKTIFETFDFYEKVYSGVNPYENM